MSVNVAFIGLGNMGYPMAGHLANNNYRVTVFNRSADKAHNWQQKFHGKTAKSPAEAAMDADFVFICVGNDDDLRQVTTAEDGAFSTIKPGTIVVDNTTTSAIVARELSEKADKLGCSFLDAPVSGGQAGAENGALTVMVGGDEKAYAKAEKMMNCFAAKVQLMGPSGYGQLTKMVNQLCIAGIVQGLSEGIHFAKRAGLNVEEVMSVISKGAAQSWQMENRYQTMDNNEFDFGFAVDWMRKDLGIALEESKHNGATLPMAKIVDGYYQQVQEIGGSRWDTSSLIALLEKAE